MDSRGTSRSSGEEHFEFWRGRVGFVLGPLAFLAILLTPLPGLEPRAHQLAAILAMTIIFWMTEAIPMAATALLAPALCVVCGVGPAKDVLLPFGSPIIFLFIGSFILAQAMQKHGLDRRIALTLLSVRGVARSPARVIAAMGLLTALLSMWMSNSAITAVMIPIALGVVRSSPQFGTTVDARSGLVLMIAFAASIGGLATPVGTPTNLVAIGSLETLLGRDVSFFQWMQLGVPLMLVLLVALFVIVRPRGRAEASPKGKDLVDEFRRERAALATFSRGELNAAIAFTFAFVLWMYPGVVELFIGKGRLGANFIEARLPEEIVGLCAGLILFFLPVNFREREFTVEWRDAAQIDWGTVLLFGGGLVLGRQIFDTGLAAAIGAQVNHLLGNPSAALLSAIAIVLSILLSETTSNTASANVMVPMMIAVAQSAGVNPVPIAIATCLACSFGFMLPISTPPNALAYSTGFVRLPTMIRCGLLLDLIGAITIWLTVQLLAPWVGWK